MTSSVLYYGDNLDVLRRHVSDDSIDLVYLDPPFKSNQDYNVLFAEQNGSRSASQIKVFEDTWSWDQAAADSYKEVVEAGGAVSDALVAFRKLLGENDMLAYLCMMAPRLVELRRVLKDVGSLYLHCDPSASHYLKVLLDAAFGGAQFRNEIIWRRTGSHNSSRRYGPIHDVLLFYSKSDHYYFRSACRPYLKGHAERYFRKRDGKGRYWTNALTGAGTRKGESGKPWRSHDPTARGRHWAIPGRIAEEIGLRKEMPVQARLDALDEAGFIDHPPDGSDAMPTYRQYLKDSPGMRCQDIWAYQPHSEGLLTGTNQGIDEDVRWLRAQGDPERLGYPTQKPLGLLERIIQSSCPEDGVVLDPFCGCGSTIVAAASLGRAWIGIDVTHLAITLMKHRLKDAVGDDLDYEVIGEPVSMPDARALAAQDPWQFQWWSLGLVGARPTEEKKGADRGIDGRIYFHDEAQASTKSIVFSVKSGKTGASDVRDLRGVLDREGAAIGVLISMQQPTKPMRKEAATAGHYDSPGWKTRHPKIQLITIAQLLKGKQVDCPPLRQTSKTFRKAARQSASAAQELTLELDGDD